MTARTLLIVDDEQDVRMLVAMALEMTVGWTVIEEEDGNRAVARAAEINPDAILLDVNIGARDGPSVFAELRSDSRTAHIPVVFLTGNVRPAQTAPLRALGAGVLAKPFEPMHLASLIAAELGWSE
jgi:CheY-like chemotaxis protein